MSRRPRGILIVFSILLASLGVAAQPAAPGRAPPGPAPTPPAPARATALVELDFRNDLDPLIQVSRAAITLDGVLVHEGPPREGVAFYQRRLPPGTHTVGAALEVTRPDGEEISVLREDRIVLRQQLRFTTFAGGPTRVELVLHPRPGPTVEPSPALDFMVAYPGREPAPSVEPTRPYPYQIPYREPHAN